MVHPKERQERFALWYEMPTIAQVATPLDARMPEGPVVLPNVLGASPAGASRAGLCGLVGLAWLAYHRAP